MATKSGLIAAVNGFITSLITQTKHRDSMLEVINELYPTKVSDSNSTETYTTKSGTVITYSIQIVKQGRTIRIDGSYINTSGAALGIGQTIFTFKVNEYRGDTSAYIGTNAEYSPYLIKNTSIMLPSVVNKFSIIINSDT